MFSKRATARRNYRLGRGLRWALKIGFSSKRFLPLVFALRVLGHVHGRMGSQRFFPPRQLDRSRVLVWESRYQEGSLTENKHRSVLIAFFPAGGAVLSLYPIAGVGRCFILSSPRGW